LVAERTGIIILSAVVAVIGCYWIVERWQVLNQVQWPRLDADALVGAAGWAAVVLIVLAAAWILSKWTAHKSHRRVKALEGAGPEGHSRATTRSLPRERSRSR
jgi:hypothetical protein